MEIRNEKEACKWLSIPTIPKKEWDGKSRFARGVGVVSTSSGYDTYVVVRFSDFDDKPTIIKTFVGEQLGVISRIFVVPQYMNEIDYEKADLDDESKEKMKILEDEAKELEAENVEKIEIPDNEYFFEHITNDDEAKAYIRAYNKQRKLKAKVPKTHQELVMRLSVIWSEENNTQK